MDLPNFRQQIDKIDEQILHLFKERMKVSRQIAFYKKAYNVPILDAAREQEKLAEINKKSEEELRPYVHKLFSTLIEISRTYQGSIE